MTDCIDHVDSLYDLKELQNVIFVRSQAMRSLTFCSGSSP